MSKHIAGREIDEWIADLASSSFLERSQALRALLQAPVTCIPAVMAAARAGKLHSAIWEGVAAWLGSYGDEGMAELCECWDEQPMLVTCALVAAGPDAVPALMEALTSESEESRRWAAYGLGQFGKEARGAQVVLRAAMRLPVSEKTRESLLHALKASEE
ncbi:MAG: hypothetical protein CSA62_00970 [Planctomycetota bacterium]|nr:MAG: hypothetical protein CSA62_00970 [Planctomycetota bacterium]